MSNPHDPPPFGAPPEQPVPGPEQPPGKPFPENPNAPSAPQGVASPDERQMAMLAHLLGGLLGFLGPLIIWVTKKDQSTFIEDQAKEALNFSLSVLIVQLIASTVGATLSCFTFGISMLLPFGVWLYALIVGIMASTKANEGQWYRYDMCIRFIK